MRRFVAAVCALAAIAAAPTRPLTATTGEAATARRFAAVRKSPPQLHAFLREMPKGGDLHSHLSGAVYAESYLRWAAEDQLCLATATLAIVAGPCNADAGQPQVNAVLRNPGLYNQAIDAMSMRHWNPAVNGHDHFFAAFAKFGPVATKFGEMLAEVAARAAAEHVSYLELMVPAVGPATQRLVRGVGWDSNPAVQRDRLLAAGFRDSVRTEAKERLDAAESRVRELLGCETPRADPGCRVTVRFIVQVPRAVTPEDVFGAMLAGFELVGGDPRVVSLDLLQAEDDPNAVRNFASQMATLDYLSRQYPAVPLTLHAGELTDGLVPPEVLRSHIRQSIEMGHARRIGHGVDVMSEDDPFGLLREMAAKKVLVEVALTSNDLILGVRGNRHPLKTYLQYHVPVALGTDDLGVSRSSHTLEFLKAVEEHDLDYPTLKTMVRNSIDYAFADPATKRRLRADLDRDFRAFEARWR